MRKSIFFSRQGQNKVSVGTLAIVAIHSYEYRPGSTMMSHNKSIGSQAQKRGPKQS